MAQRWEHGSFLPFTFWPPSPPASPWPPEVVLLGTGRQALRHIVKAGIAAEGWQRLLLPSYVCPSVLDAVRPLIPVTGYRHLPLQEPAFPRLADSDAILVAAHFGVEPTGYQHLPSERVILDLSHDPLAPWADRAHHAYAFASVRKTLPVPDGGLAWAGEGRALPQVGEPTVEQVELAEEMVIAMYLKGEFLAGADVAKAEYLARARRFEERVVSLPDGAGTHFTAQVLARLPVASLRATRIEGAQTLGDLLAPVPQVSATPTPFGVVLTFESEDHRDGVRAELVRAGIYPAVLWDVDREFASPEDIDWSARMLHLHSDYRYDGCDLERVAGEVLRAVKGAGT